MKKMDSRNTEKENNADSVVNTLLDKDAASGSFEHTEKQMIEHDHASNQMQD